MIANTVYGSVRGVSAPWRLEEMRRETGVGAGQRGDATGEGDLQANPERGEGEWGGEGGGKKEVGERRKESGGWVKRGGRRERNGQRRHV